MEYVGVKSLLTVFVAQCHDPVHVVRIVRHIPRKIFDIHANIWSFFNLLWRGSTLYDAQQLFIPSVAFCQF